MNPNYLEQINDILENGPSHGGFVNTDGTWCTCTKPNDFKAFLESIGLEVKECYSTAYSNAIAKTYNGAHIAQNGFVKKIK